MVEAVIDLRDVAFVQNLFAQLLRQLLPHFAWRICLTVRLIHGRKLIVASIVL